MSNLCDKNFCSGLNGLFGGVRACPSWYGLGGQHFNSVHQHGSKKGELFLWYIHVNLFALVLLGSQAMDKKTCDECAREIEYTLEALLIRIHPGVCMAAHWAWGRWLSRPPTEAQRSWTVTCISQEAGSQWTLATTSVPAGKAAVTNNKIIILISIEWTNQHCVLGFIIDWDWYIIFNSPDVNSKYLIVYGLGKTVNMVLNYVTCSTTTTNRYNNHLLATKAVD